MKVYSRIILVLIILIISLNFQSCSNQQVLYDLDNIPIVETHTHLSGKEAFDYCIKAMDDWGGTISISLNNNTDSLWQYIEDSLDNRILMCRRGNSFTVEEVQDIKDKGFIGIKTHLRYHTKLSEVTSEQIKKMGEVGLPFMCLHLGDPPEDVWHVPDKYMVHHRDAEQVIRNHPETIFIMAHGFYLTNKDSDIDTLRSFFERCPNLYCDIACTKWWDAPQPSYTKIRNLLIEYKDRFLFGTDFNKRRTSDGFKFVRERLETDKPLTFGLNGGHGPGLALPLDVLNHIYYWNAAKLIPKVKESLIKLGYEIGDKPPESDPIDPDLNYNPPQVDVLIHPANIKRSRKFTVTLDLSKYDRAVHARLNIMSYKKKLMKTLYEGEWNKEKKTFTWNSRNEEGKKVKKGMYRLWLILNNNKCAESNFNIQ
jgi:hypothetical protein